jgi:hypothetical protein
MASNRLTVELAIHVATRCVMPLCLALGSLAFGQVAYPEREVRVHDLPALTARSTRSPDVLATSLEMVFNDKEICCGKDSALEDSVEAADAKSLKDIAGKMQGRHSAKRWTPDHGDGGISDAGSGECRPLDLYAHGEARGADDVEFTLVRGGRSELRGERRQLQRCDRVCGPQVLTAGCALF